MKKVYSLLAVGALALSSVTSAYARYWTYNKDASISASEIQEGKNYVFQSGRSQIMGATWLLTGETFTNAENFEATTVYTLENTGRTTSDGAKIYRIKRVSDGQYVSKVGNGQFYTSQTERAWELTFREPTIIETGHTATIAGGAANGTDSVVTNVYSGAADNASQKSNGAYWDIRAYIKEMQLSNSPTLYKLSTVTYTDVTPETGVVIADALPKDATNLYSPYNFFMTHRDGNVAAEANKGENYGRNLWIIREATELSGKEAIAAQLALLFGTQSLADKYQNFERGEASGQYSASAYATLEAEYNKAKSIADGTLTASEAEMDSVAARLPRYMEAFANSGKPLTEGYYIIRNWRSSAANTSNRNNYDDGAIYDASAVNPTDNTVRWSYTKSDNVVYYDTLAKDYKTAKFIWQVIADASKPGYFFFKNAYTGRYIGTQANLYKTVGTTDTPQYSYKIDVNPEQPGFFSFYSDELIKGKRSTLGGLHAAGDASNIVGWDYRQAESSWRVLQLTDAEVAALVANVAPLVRIDQAKALIPQAQALFESGKSYIGLNADGTRNNNSVTGAWDVDGLVTSKDNVASPMADSDEGQDLGVLFDGQYNTYFHSSWHGGNGAWTGDHYLQVTLPNAESEILVKWIKRIIGNSANNSGAPANVVFWGTNDASKLSIAKDASVDPVNYNAWKTSWDSLATATFKYNSEIKFNNGADRTDATGAGYAYAKFASAYKYIRIAVKTRVSDGDIPSGNKYYHASEFRIYRGAYDNVNSLNEAIDTSVKDNLNNAIAALQAEVTAGTVNESTLQALRDAMTAYEKATPNTSALKASLAAAKALVTAAVEGTDPGYYNSGAKATATADLTTIENDLNTLLATRQPNVTEVANYTARIKAVLATFDTQFIRPTSGIYFIRSNSSNAAVQGNVVFAPTASRTTSVKYTGMKQNPGSNPATYAEDGIYKNRLGSYWQIEKVDTGYTIKSLFTGLYLRPIKGQRTLSQSDTAYVFKLQYAQVEGCFNLVISTKDAASGGHIYANAEPGTGNIVMWSSASGQDNSAFKLESADVTNVLNDGFRYDLQSKTGPQIITLPVDLIAGSTGFYSVIGQDAANNIQLQAETGVIKAGQAYVYIPDPSNTEDQATFYTETSLPALVYGNKALPAVNGLVGTFEAATPAEQSGIFNATRTQVLVSERGEGVAAGTGYFTQMPATTATGAKTIPANGTITGLVAVVLPNGKLNTGIYSLSGVRFSNSNKLPAGIYVVNGKKVVVK